MSDLLSHLALRTLQPATAPALLQPRLPSLFEASGGLDQIAEPPMESESEKSAASPESAAEPRLPSISEKPKASPLSVEPQRTIQPPLEHEVTLNARRAPKESGPALPLPSGEKPRTGSILVNELPIKRNPRPVEQDQAPQADRRQSHHIFHSLVESVPVSGESKPALIVPVTASALRQPTELEASPERAPVVQIRIGRIEVRATTSAPASPTSPSGAARRPPKLTLDDYLQQRNAGKR